MKIWIHGLEGDMDKINGLNHYIGMATIHEENFPEFAVLPYAFGLLIALTAALAWFKRRWLISVVLGYAAIFATTLFYRFWAWEYDYGHNLDPTAAIKIPGMSYQPPLFGWKGLLNFLAGSLPDYGAWASLAAVVLVLWIGIREKVWSKASLSGAATVLILSGTLASCTRKVEAIHYQVDQCEFCRMTISDERFGSAILTSKGRTLTFDSMECMVSHSACKEHGSTCFATNFTEPGVLKSVDELTILKGDQIQSPMGGGLVALSDAAMIASWADSLHAEVLTWNELIR